MKPIFVDSIHEVMQKTARWCQNTLNGKIKKKKKTLYTSNSFKISFQQDHDANEGKATAYNWSITILFLES